MDRYKHETVRKMINDTDKLIRTLTDRNHSLMKIETAFLIMMRGYLIQHTSIQVLRKHTQSFLYSRSFIVLRSKRIDFV